jgi:hypothetical protein
MKNVITVMQWYDKVTPESASEGTYAETGCGMVENTTDDINEAAQWFFEAVKDLGYFDVNGLLLNGNGAIDWCNEVVYASDSIVDYTDGSEEHHCVAVKVPKKLQSKFNALVDQLLNA